MFSVCNLSYLRKVQDMITIGFNVVLDTLHIILQTSLSLNLL